jgi:hypothetical protein
MKFTPKSFEEPWEPKKIVGNTAYYYNSKTGLTRSEFVPANELSERKKEFADWFKVTSKFRKRTPSGQIILVRKKDYTKLSRDPLAPFDYSYLSKREGVVTQVLSANRLVINGDYVVTVPGIQIPSKRNDPEEWLKAKKFTESLVQGKRVYLGVNMNNPYAENGDILASVDFDMPQPNQQDQGWGIFDYLNLSGYAIGAAARNIASEGSIMGKASIGDRYDLSDTFTFTRFYHQLIGDTKQLSPTSRGETEGEWYEKLAIDIIFDPLNYISIGTKGIALGGRRILKGARYMRPISLVKKRAIKWANSYESHIPVGGAGKAVDVINREWRRVNLLLEPAFYAAVAQLDFWNSMLAGINPIRYFNIDPILRGAKNPAIRKTLALRVPGKPGGGYTYQEIEAFLKEYHLGESTIGDISRNPYLREGLAEKVWNPLLSIVAWQSSRTQGALFIDGLKKGMDPATAAERVRHFLPYDPRYLTAFEKAYLNRIMPYYTPTTRNIALQVEQLLKTPYKYTTVAKWQIQQRQFAGEDQFKDYERDTIIQKIGDGKYVKLRFPTEDLTQLPGKYASIRKGFLSSTYPIWNIWPELYEDKNYFDDTTPSLNMPDYLLKKFVSREYYAVRDWRNPNMPISEKISKHIFAVGLLEPNNRLSYKKSLIDAGFSPTQAEQDIANTIRRQETFRKNALATVAKAQIQAALPEEQRDRPDKLELGWEMFQYPQWGLWGFVSNFATLVQSGRMGTKGILDRTMPTDLYRASDALKIIDKMTSGGMPQPTYNLFGQNLRDVRNSVADFAEDFLLDPLLALGWAGKIGRVILVGGKTKVLTKAGQAKFAKLNPVVVSGRAEGLYGKRAAIRMEAEANIKFLKYAEETPGAARKLMVSPGFQIFGRTVLTQDALRASISTLKLPVTLPLKGVGILSKEIIDTMAPVKKYIAERAGASEILKTKWKDDFQRQYDEWFQNTKMLKKASTVEVQRMESQANIKLGIWTNAKRMHKADPSHGYFYYASMLSKQTAVKLTDFVEIGKADTSAQGVVDDITKEFARMANEEIPKGLLSKTRMNYVEHIVLSKYKFLQGYTDPILNKLHIRAPFAKHRAHDATIAEYNAEVKAKYGTEIFETNIWKILKVRKAQHIEAVETYDFLRRIAGEQGISRTWEPFLKGTYGVSSNPIVQDILLPIETIRAIDRISILRAHTSLIHTKPGIFKNILDKYDWLTSFYKRNIILFNPGFIPRNTISSLHQSVMAGFYDVTKYLPQRANQGIAFVTREGRQVYSWELNQWYDEYKVINQPGMAVAGTREMDNTLDRLGGFPRWATIQVENLIRTRLFNSKIMEGMTPAQAGQYVIDHHLDYTKKYTPAMAIASRFIMFPTWTTGAPVMVGRNMVERPWQFSMTSKVIDAWNQPSDEIMLKYRPESMNPHMMFKVPGTEDAFYSPPFATSELMAYPVILRTKEFQFYWGEALNNPNTLKRFARANIEIDWLKRGGGKATAKNGIITIEYMTTGEVIRAYLSGHNTLVFVDGNNNAVIREFETRGYGNKTEIIKEGEIVNELMKKYVFPWISIPVNAWTSEKYKPQSTGNPTTDALNTIVQLTGFGAMQTNIQDFIEEETPLWAKIIEVFGLGIVWFAHTGVGMEREPDKEVVRRATESITGNYRGCGF